MLYLNLNNKPHYPISWYVGKKLDNFDPSQVGAVQVDGDEKVYIEDMFPNLPQSRARVVIYEGEFARFIATNLPICIG